MRAAPKLTKMSRSTSAAWLSDAVEPLRSRFGGELTLRRDGDAVRWDYGGCSAVAELTADGRMHLRFIDRSAIDAVTNRPATAVYRSRESYALNSTSCSHAIGDIVDFFSGKREPAFTFIDAY